MKETILVEGMTCGKCEAAVKGALNEINGVKEVTVDLSTGNVDVEHENVNTAELEDAIEGQGYDVVKA